jgi:hypothetical protein
MMRCVEKLFDVGSPMSDVFLVTAPLSFASPVRYARVESPDSYREGVRPIDCVWIFYLRLRLKKSPTFQ